MWEVGLAPFTVITNNPVAEFLLPIPAVLTSAGSEVLVPNKMCVSIEMKAKTAEYSFCSTNAIEPIGNRNLQQQQQQQQERYPSPRPSRKGKRERKKKALRIQTLQEYLGHLSR